MTEEGQALRLEAGETQSGLRLDKALAGLVPDLSRARLQALIAGGQASVDGEIVTTASRRLKPGQSVVLIVPPPADPVPKAETIPLVIVHEDNDLIVIDKPAGLVVHPAAGHEDGTLVNALIAHCGDSLSGIGGVRRPGIVHRLDKDTSGLLVVAKNDRAHQALSAQFADHGRTGPLERAYLALVWGRPERPRGTITTGIDRHPRARDRMAVVAEGRGREAITHYEVLASYPAAAALTSLVRCELETGRTHQIRVHMAHLGHPLLGDRVYGAHVATKAAKLPDAPRAALAVLGRQALHATLLGFAHPADSRHLSFDSPPPPEMAHLIEALARM
jgi:23S rRNA pseudouridine1911/1915/1917 synthase